ncbi:MAG: HAD family phosphatase [Actinomycetes bacterium]
MIGFKLVIFDNDGVLVDSEPIANRHLAELLGDYGLDIDWYGCVERYLGCTLGRVRELAESDLGHPIPDDFEARYRASVYPSLASGVEAVAGADAVLHFVAMQQTAMCVASSARHERIRLTLDRAGLRRYFEDEWLFSADDVGVGKPAPDLFLFAAQTLGVDPSTCAVIEDSPAGVDAGLAAGMTVFAYSALTPRHLLEHANGAVFDSMASLPELLKG